MAGYKGWETANKTDDRQTSGSVEIASRSCRISIVYDTASDTEYCPILLASAECQYRVVVMTAQPRSRHLSITHCVALINILQPSLRQYLSCINIGIGISHYDHTT